jgi:hypothetical protein
VGLEPGKSGFAAALAAEQEHRSFRSRPSQGTTMSESRTEQCCLSTNSGPTVRSWMPQKQHWRGRLSCVDARLLFDDQQEHEPDRSFAT